MRIAFVGKGGSGKTTFSVLFAQYLTQYVKPVVLVDADLNMHSVYQLGLHGRLSEEKHLSHPNSVIDILTYLKGKNERIKDIKHFKKTTPPTKDSNFIKLNDLENYVLRKYSVGDDRLRLMAVGTYAEDGIGVSCYHNNLSIFENILTHLIDKEGVLVADMVAGTDAFASTLHAQFDLIVLVVEPTLKGVEVFEQYRGLSQAASVYESVFVVGNKIRSTRDKEFMEMHIPKDKMLGFFSESDYLRVKEQEGGTLEVQLLEDENAKVLETIKEKLFKNNTQAKERIQRLFELHKKYVNQAYIKDRFGDLTDQIDESFDILQIYAQ